MKEIKIDWNNNWANNPTIQFVLSERPDFNIKFEKKVINEKVFYFGENNGIVEYYVYNPKNTNGSYGSTFRLPMVDGSVDLVKGIWLTNPHHMVEVGYEPTNEIDMVKENNGGHWGGVYFILTSKLVELFEKFLPDVQYEFDESGIITIPKDQPANKEKK